MEHAFLQAIDSADTMLDDVAAACGWYWVVSVLLPPAGKPFGDPIATPENPSAGAHKKLFYNNDFSYLDESPWLGDDLGDAFKQLPAGDWGTVDFGGQLRMQYKHEVGMGQAPAGPAQLRFQDYDTDTWLTRLRLYSNWQVDDSLRFYVEGHYADVTDDHGAYVPRIFDRNFGDFLNAFVDVTPIDGATLRVGRQELIYGAERLISITNWVNSRRTFEGARLLMHEGNWNVDAFYTAFVPWDANELDQADWKQPFYGVYSTYTDSPGNLIDLYYIGYDNRNDDAPIVSDYSLHTVGTRYFRTIDAWMFEFEGGGQFGRQSGLGLDHRAGFSTVGVGHSFANWAWSPVLWGYFDYASGNAGGGAFNRFNHLFPWSHQFMGYIDAVQRSNIETPNVLLTMKPTERLELLFWYYYFMANQAGDTVPSVTATPPQSLASDNLGQELDFTARYFFGPRSNILFGYSHFWKGSKILAPQDADFFYSQWELNF